MADKKISALTSASTPLAGTEVLPIVQSGSTVKVAVSDLTAGRTVTASNFSGAGTSLTGTANSLNAGIGVNQTWQAVTRVIGTTYTNSTGKPIMAAVSYTCTSGPTVQGFIINGATVYAGAVAVATTAGGFALIVPDGATYVTTTNAGTLALVAWAELR